MNPYFYPIRHYIFASVSFLLLSISLLYAQAPQGISFQAVARDASGLSIASTTVSVRFTVKNGGGTTVYQETQSVTTDGFGLFTASIGRGTVVSGTFANVDWAATQHSVEIEVDNGAGYGFVGSCAFESVPYAFYADKVGNMNMHELADVDTNSLVPGQTLVWDGANWVPGSGTDSIWNKTGSSAYYRAGRVGIGMTSPDATLHLPDTSNVLWGDSLSGSGYKLIWYGQKGALRFGYLDNPFGGYNYQNFWNNDSVGFFSFAGGRSSRAKGFGAFAWGSFGWADGSGSVAFFGNARGNNSFTFGGSSKGRGSITFEGVADEEGGIAMYGYTGGRYGVSIGGGTTGLGASSSREDYAIAIGWNSDARGQASVALGPSDAYGYNSFSTGWVTEARGNYSSTFGYQTNSYAYASMALGRYNRITGDSAAWVATDPIFIVGDGTSNANRSNAFMIQKNGQTAVGYDTPTGMLNVSSALGSLNNGGTFDPARASLLLGNTTTGLAFDPNQIEVIGTGLHLNFNSPQDVYLVNGGGDVGIGNAAPDAKLDVTSIGWQFHLENTDAGGNDWFIGSSANAWAAGGGKFLISPNGTSSNSAFTILDNGRIGIGNPTPSDRLEVYAAAGEDALRVRIGGTTRLRVHDNGGVSIGVNAGPPAEGLLVQGESRFDDRIIPNADNAYDMGATTRRWRQVFAVNGTIQTSDYRLKTDIQPLPYGLETVLQLRPVRYQWKDNPGSKAKIGLIAQEVEEVVPEVVHTPENADAYLGMNYAEMVPVLIQAIQDQQAQIEALEAQVKAQGEALEALREN
ncbi:MAG: tail fiber domain-containing protein [Bacteroidota bacterium]